MNSPDGFEIVDGRVVDPRPWDALLNGHVAHELVHMYLAGYMVAGFVVAAVYARAWLAGRRDTYHRTGLVVALSFAAFAAPVQWATGPVARWRTPSA
jgi:cytochrome d ubiquinol oxidase subunit I